MTADLAPAPEVPRFESRLVLHDSARARVLRALAIVCLAVGLGGTVLYALATRMAHGEVAFGLGAATLASCIALLAAAQRDVGDGRRRLAVTADARGLGLAGRRALPLGALAAGYVVDAAGAPRVCLVGQRGELVLELGVADEAEARALLAALDLGVGAHAAEYRLAPGVLRGGKASAATAAALAVWSLVCTLGVKTLGPASLAIGFVGMIAGLSVAGASTVVRIGRDGVALRGLRRRRFVAFAELERVEPSDDGLALVLCDGERVGLRTPPFGAAPDPARELRDAVVARIAAALGAHRELEQAAAGARLGRGTRDTTRWITGLEELALGIGDDYRAGALTRDALWRLVESPGASLPTRAAAAVALRQLPSEERQARLRRVARAVASPALQKALESVAAGVEVAPLGRALEAVEAEVALGARAGRGE